MAEPCAQAPASARNEGAEPSGFTIEGAQIRARKPAPGLHIVATPIGNLEDVTLRALHALAGADRVYCEDTRITRRLLERYTITARLGIYDDHRGQKARAEIMRLVTSGASVVLVSDAGTPLISDPGFKLVREMRDAGLPVFVIPGASALTAAAAIAGLATDRLFFAGFLAPKRAARRRAICELAEMAATLVLYESPRRLAATLADLADILGPREAAIARELTKINEQVVRLPLDQLAERYAGKTVRGEIVILIAAAQPQA
ncbi:MAG: 16S rRNA (cytidine(1402)-2'-O)-methyltransferase, partial [Rhizobiales bacterium]|nr:16S rRNA (cytidine(1402)-2'-O)-methyltransferase [Hyphomicrobiales bacterium]